MLPAAAGLLARGNVTLVNDSSRLASLEVAAGHTLRFDPSKNVTLELRGNLVVRGTLEMKPNKGVRHILRFVGIDETRFVGGGMTVLSSDVGLWVMGNGKLDIRGDPRAGWNDTGAGRDLEVERRDPHHAVRSRATPPPLLGTKGNRKLAGRSLPPSRVRTGGCSRRRRSI